jgi:hypothetical protein
VCCFADGCRLQSAAARYHWCTVACSSAASASLRKRECSCCSALCYACRWVPVAERSRSLLLVYICMFIGSICGTCVVVLTWPGRCVDLAGSLC